MESRYEDLTKEQLIAELNVAKEKTAYYQSEEIKLKITLDDVRGRLEVFEKKREVERKLGEAKDFLLANGYEVRPLTVAERFPVEQTLQGGVQVRKPERIWRDEDMKAFAGLCFFGPTQSIPLTEHIKAQLEVYAERKKYQP